MGLSLSSIMEAAFCCIALKDQFIPGSAHVKNPDPELEHLELVQQSNNHPLNRIMSNSSGFGGANVSVIFERKPDVKFNRCNSWEENFQTSIIF